MRKGLLLLIPLLLALVLQGCAPAVPKHDTNICDVFLQYPKWYKATKKTQKRWGVPIAVQMAIIHQESHFSAKIKPDRQQVFGAIPWKRPSTSYGYTQALKTTWQNYEKDIGKKRDRTSFDDASDFVGWYGYQANKRANISQSNAHDLYLAYHEGITGYQQQTYAHKKWLLHVANKVQHQADSYQWQLDKCEKKFKHKSWFH